jgi:hypothetical protein
LGYIEYAGEPRVLAVALLNGLGVPLGHGVNYNHFQVEGAEK